MAHTFQNVSHVEKHGHILKMDHTEKIVTLVKNGICLENGGTLGKTGVHFYKCVTIGKIGHIWKLGLTWKNVFHLAIWLTLLKWVTRRQMCHTEKNGYHLKKCVTLKK